jgi:hypothetical protein
MIMSEVIELIILQILPWLIVILGLAGNVLSFLMFSRKNLHKLSVHIYFRALAITDSFNLLLFVQYLVSYIFNQNLETVSIEICKLSTYLSYVIPCLSSFILVLLSFDRFMCVFYPSCSWFRKPSVQITLLILVFTFNIGFYVTVALAHTLHLNSDSEKPSHILSFHQKNDLSKKQCVCKIEKACKIIKIIDVIKFSYFFIFILLNNSFRNNSTYRPK